MDTHKRRIPITCPECERAMRYAQDANGVGMWRCVCGQTEGEFVDPRQAPPAANVRVFDEDKRQQGPI